MNPLLREALESAARSLLKIAAGYLVARGIWSNEQAASYIAPAAVALVGLGLSLWTTYRSRQKLVTALVMPVGATEDEVKAVIDNPSIKTPPVSLPKNQAPDPLTYKP